MRCRDVLRLSTLYLDGDLDIDRSSAVRGHLRTCESCAEAVAGEEVVRDAAADLDPQLDPPSGMWSLIQSRVAEQEIADSDRPRAWFWLSAVRPWALHGAIAVAAVIALVVWLRNADDPSDTPVVVTPAEPGVTPPATPDPAAQQPPVLEFEEARAEEIRAADQRFQRAITELREIAEAERQDWSTARASEFDSRLGVLEERARSAASRIASVDPRDRLDLYAAYRDEINFLQRVALEVDQP